MVERNELRKAIKTVEDKIGEYRAFNMGLGGTDMELWQKVEDSITQMRFLQLGLKIATEEINLEDVSKFFRVKEIEFEEMDFV